MYTQIDSNKRKTWFLVVLFLLIIVGIGWALAQLYNSPSILIIATVIALIQAWVGYYYSDVVALASSGAIAIPDEGGWKRVHRAVENAALTAGLPKPRVYFIDDSSPNAFATGRDPQHAAVAVTRGLLEKLDKRELEGVLAHEMSHVGNYDIRTMSIVVVLVGVIVLTSDWVLRWMPFGGRQRSNDGETGSLLAIVALVLIILSPIIAMLIQLAVSRKREFLADASGVLLTRDPDGLADALERISADRTPLAHANKATAHLYIANPFKAGFSGSDARRWFVRLFDTHPPIEERVKRLRAMV